MPDCRLSWDLGADGYLSILWLLAPNSWVSVHESTVRQAGPRRLFDEVISAYTWWQHAGCPRRDRYGVTVTRVGQAVWLDFAAPTTLVGRCRELDNTDVLVAGNVGPVEFTGHGYRHTRELPRWSRLNLHS
ncbi:MAG: hypothetical protein WBV74_02900 [Pseudonocardiaceae bacterium]